MNLISYYWLIKWINTFFMQGQASYCRWRTRPSFKQYLLYSENKMTHSIKVQSLLFRWLCVRVLWMIYWYFVGIFFNGNNFIGPGEIFSELPLCFWNYSWTEPNTITSHDTVTTRLNVGIVTLRKPIVVRTVRLMAVIMMISYQTLNGIWNKDGL